MSNSSDYSNWRLISNGGIKYRFLGLTGSFDLNAGDVLWKGMVRAEDFMAFALELFPPVHLVGNLAYQSAGTLPGWPNMIAKKLTFKSMDGEGGLPCDALSTDPSAPVGTYHGFIEVEVSFGSGNAKDPDPADPRTFLEITSQTSGEFIYAPPGATKLEEETSSLGDADEVPGDANVDPDTGRYLGTKTPGTRLPNRNPILPTVIRVPTTDWNIRWKGIPSDYYRNVAVYRLRYLNGRVNSANCAFLYNAPPETLLFTGFEHSEMFTWNGSYLDNPPLNLDIKITEKYVPWKGVICGHNHVWDPGIGWKRAWIGVNGDEPLYRSAVFDFLFKI